MCTYQIKTLNLSFFQQSKHQFIFTRSSMHHINFSHFSLIQYIYTGHLMSLYAKQPVKPVYSPYLCNRVIVSYPFDKNVLPFDIMSPSRNCRKPLSYHVTTSCNYGSTYPLKPIFYLTSNRVQLTKLNERKIILIITALNPFQANILFLYRLVTSEHHMYNRSLSGVKMKWVKQHQHLYEQLNCGRS